MRKTTSQKASNHLLWLFGMVVALGFSYLSCRFAMFDSHHMKQWPTALAAVALIILILSFFRKTRMLSAAAVFGYIGGFAIAFLFHSDGVDAGGARSNNLWMIWAVVFLLCILIGCAVEIAWKKKK